MLWGIAKALKQFLKHTKGSKAAKENATAING